MRIAVVGLGHVGLVSAAAFATVGHDVAGVEADPRTLAMLREGTLPFVEPDLGELVCSALGSGRLHLHGGLDEVVLQERPLVFLCVGTPATASGQADLLEVERLGLDIAAAMRGFTVIVEKSTVPARTGDRLARVLRRALGHERFAVVSNPEFLRQGSAVADTLHPSRIVVGSSSPEATELMREVYRPIIQGSGCPMLVTTVPTAELIKHASNAFLATKISFINAVAEVCERVGADVEDVAQGMGLDPRIGPSFLRAGLGYGGSCFPKDVAAFAALGRELGAPVPLLEEVQRVNERCVDRLLDRLRAELWHLSGKTVAMLGLSFKPGTDDLRSSPPVRLAERLLAEGASIVGYDPVAGPAARRLLAQVRLAAGPYEAAAGADAVVVGTDWDEFRALDLGRLAAAMRVPILADGRNLFRPDDVRAAGLVHLSPGRPWTGREATAAA